MRKCGRIGKLSLLVLFGFLMLSSAALAADLDPFAGLEGSISIAGGTAHIPVMNDAAKNISTFNPKIRITVEGGGTGIGVQRVGEGLVDIGNTGRALSEEEIAKFGLKSFPFALDGVAVVVHPENPVTELAAEQIRDLFAGKVLNWKEMGGQAVYSEGGTDRPGNGPNISPGCGPVRQAH
jgi:phosphate transport system substrate-binding protein